MSWAGGSPSRKARHAIDIIMTVMMILLMGYHLWGEALHEWLGVAVFLLFMIHHLMNRSWYRSIPKGRYSFRRALMLCIDSMLFASAFMQIISGLAMSVYVPPVASVLMPVSIARPIHLAMSYWSYVLISLHIGLHLGIVIQRIRNRRLFWAAAIAIAIWGCIAFVRRNILSYMFLLVEFAFLDYGESRLVFVIEYICMMVLFSILLYCISLSGKRKERQ